MVKKDIILIGGGGHCKSCIDVIEQEGIYKIAGIIDVTEKLGEKILGYEIIGTDYDLPGFVKKGYKFFITLGQIKTPELRMKFFSKLIHLNVKLPVVISPRAYVSRHTKIGQGTIVMHNALVNAGATVGSNCIINTKALIEHDAIIGDHCHISTGAIVNGGVEVGEGTFFGSGAVSKQYIRIEPNSFIKANSIVK